MLHLTEICSNDLFNIGAGEEFSIRQFAALICEYLGYDFKDIRFDESKYVRCSSK